MDKGEEMLRTSVIRFSGEVKRGSVDRAKAFVFIEWLLCEVHPWQPYCCQQAAVFLPVRCFSQQGCSALSGVGLTCLRSLSHWLEALNNEIPTLALLCNIELCVKLFRRSLPDVCCILHPYIHFPLLMHDWVAVVSDQINPDIFHPRQCPPTPTRGSQGVPPQKRYVVLPSCSGSPQDLLPVGHAWNTSRVRRPESLLTRCQPPQLAPFNAEGFAQRLRV